MQDIKVSVIMSVYNGERFLKQSIDSILIQSFRNFEFIIIDDGSIDNTKEILREYENKDKRIKIISNEKNVGLSKSLNKGLNLVCGDYIARMDSDDISLPNRLRKQVSFMDNNPEIGLLGTAYYEIDENDNIIGIKHFPCEDYKLRKTLIKYNPFFHASVMIRRKILEHIGKYDEVISKAQDYELWFRIAKVSKIANLDELLMKRRYTKDQISIKYENEQIKWAINIRKKVIKEKQYNAWNYFYLIRPYILLKTPYRFRYFIRKYLLKSRVNA